MTSWFSVIVAGGLLGLLLAQVPAAWSLVRGFRRRPEGVALGHSPEPASTPRAAAILCVRGADETLAQCLDALVHQDYPNYEVVVIVDSEADPGWGIVNRVVNQQTHVPIRLEVLGRRLETCGLKCSALIQAVNSLDESIGLVALCDADTVPHRTWLRELTAPLADPTIGAAGGVRWYMPRRASWAALVRYCWNVPAIGCMNAYGIAWGGSLALRRDAITRAGLLEKWGLAYCEDTMTRAALEPAGLKFVYVPSLVMVHRDDCRIGAFAQWCVRQMLTSRLYHPAWRLIVAHGVATTLAWILPLTLVLVAAITGDVRTAGIIAAILAGYWLIQWAALLLVEQSAQRPVARRGEPTDWLSPGIALKLVGAIPLTQWIYFGILVATLRVRRVCWREVWYDIAGPFDIRRLGGDPKPAAVEE